MAWRRPGDQCWLVYRRIYASLGLSQLSSQAWNLIINVFADVLSPTDKSPLAGTALT